MSPLSISHTGKWKKTSELTIIINQMPFLKYTNILDKKPFWAIFHMKIKAGPLLDGGGLKVRKVQYFKKCGTIIKSLMVHLFVINTYMK